MFGHLEKVLNMFFNVETKPGVGYQIIGNLEMELVVEN
jgi:hypothetical protein